MVTHIIAVTCRHATAETDKIIVRIVHVHHTTGRKLFFCRCAKVWCFQWQGFAVMLGGGGNRGKIVPGDGVGAAEILLVVCKIGLGMGWKDRRNNERN